MKPRGGKELKSEILLEKNQDVMRMEKLLLFKTS